MITVCLVDDHDIVRMGLKKILSDVSGFKVLGEARTGEEACLMIRKLHPNVVLMDIKMPGMDGFETVRKLLNVDPDLKILVLTICDNAFYPSQLLKRGASGYVTKESGPEEVVRAIRAVHAGQRYISPEIASRVVLQQMDMNKHPSPFCRLSDRESQITLWIIKGISAQAIAERLCVSPKTINAHRYRIFRKLSVKNDVELTLLAIRHGLINLEEFVPEG